MTTDAQTTPWTMQSRFAGMVQIQLMGIIGRYFNLFREKSLKH